MHTDPLPARHATQIRALAGGARTLLLAVLLASAGPLCAGPITPELAQSAADWQRVLDQPAIDGDCTARLAFYVQSWTQFQLPNVQALAPEVDVDDYLAELESTLAAATAALRTCPSAHLPALVADLRKGGFDETGLQALEAFLQPLATDAAAGK